MAFNSVPIEVNQMIASKLDCDADIASFRAVCHSTAAAVDCEKHSYWRLRFNAIYDPPRSGTCSHSELKDQYQTRNRILRQPVRFAGGGSRNERNCLTIIRDLLKDAFTGHIFTDANGLPTCRNMEIVKEFVAKSGLLRDMCHHRTTTRLHPLLLTIQVMLTHMNLDQSLHFNVMGFPESQRVAYLSCRGARIFEGRDHRQVNMEWLMHVANFFKYHCVRKEEENSLYAAIEELSSGQKPRAWEMPLGDDSQKLERYWRGTYAFLERREVRALRASTSATGSEIFMDQHVDGEKPIQTMQLDFPDHETEWPDYFEYHLESKSKRYTTPSKVHSQHRLGGASFGETAPVRFQGSGHDDYEDFNSAGYLNRLPAQNGVPGWQRMTMMKYYVDDDGEIDMEALWAYEGVVLPGNRIVLGRWWSPDDDHLDNAYSGPFILWAVEPPLETEAEDKEAGNTDKD